MQILQNVSIDVQLESSVRIRAEVAWEPLSFLMLSCESKSITYAEGVQ